MFSAAYHAVIYDPLLNVLVWLYSLVGDIGIAIILVTILIRLVLHPLSMKGARYQKVMQEIQPKLKQIQDNHKDDLVKQSEAMMALYQEHEVHPFSGFVLFVQLPVLIALYQIFGSLFKGSLAANLYSFVQVPASISGSFLGLLNLANPSIVLTCVAAGLQYLQVRMMGSQMTGGDDTQRAMMRFTSFLGPGLILLVFWKLPAAMGVYLITTTLITLYEQSLITRRLTNERLARISNRDGADHGV
jgi:YidC/Oxa1 family membrane protein insertase